MSTPPSFGQWVRQRRKALDLTQALLAKQIDCSVSAIEKIEADRRRPARSLAERLADALAIDTGERPAFLRAARAIEPTIEQPQPSNLPSVPTSFIGRKQESAAIRALLRQDEVRLLTLTGTGGVGKTRLALHVAADLGAEFAHGVLFVGLATARDAGRVVGAIAQAVGVQEGDARSLLDQLKHALRDRHMLLLLDNFEYVLDAAPILADLLAAAPALKLLVTSRVALGVDDEHEFVVPPLELPNLRRLPSVPVLAQNAAVALFTTRAQAVAPDFALTRTNAPEVAEICLRLDGLPLAIELAATRSRIFGPETLLARLSHRLVLLTGGARDRHPRQQTMRATIAWSYDLLTPEERALFARLAVFVGGCTFAAVEQICATVGARSINALDSLSALLDQNLLQQESGDEPRFSMLETVREYALECLADSGEADAVRRQHAQHYLILAETAEPELTGANQTAWFARLTAEHDNLRAVLSWACEHEEAEIALRLSGALWRFWKVQGHNAEGRTWLERALAIGAGTSAAYAKALHRLGSFVEYRGDPTRAITLYEESLALFRALNDKQGMAQVLNGLGICLMFQSAYSRAEATLVESLAFFRELDLGWGIATALNNLGAVALYQIDLPKATTYYTESLEHERAQGNAWGIAASLQNLADIHRNQGDYAIARRYGEEGLAMFEAMNDKPGTAHAHNNLGDIALAQGDYPHATYHLAACRELYQELGDQGRGMAGVLHSLGLLALSQSEYRRAIAHFQECLQRFERLGQKEGITQTIEALAEIALAHEQQRRAAQLIGAGELLRQQHNLSRALTEQANYDQIKAKLAICLDEQTLAAEQARGSTMTIANVINYAAELATIIDSAR